jgi:Leucine-rich repeat (LRR) protein
MDPEYKVNVPALLQLYEDAGYDKQDFMTASCMSGSFMTSSKCFRSLWPFHAVVINWHSLSLPQIELDWLYKACWQHTLKPPPDVDIKITLASITRLDVSNNKLHSLPPQVFQMPSLKSLNASKNSIEELVFEEEVTTPVIDGAGYEVVLKDPSVTVLNVKPVFSRSVKPSKSAWTCSVLEEVNFHSNKLQTIHADVFKLPGLIRANFSDNCIDNLPFEMWFSPKLNELNLSRNNLSTLPMSQYGGLGGVPVPIDRTPTHENLSVASSYGSPGTSEPGTPLRAVTINTSESVNLCRQSMPNPPSSLSLSSPNHTYPDSPEAVQSPTPPYEVLPVTYLNQWTDKIRIRSSLGQDTTNSSCDTQSKLSELNLSHNAFQSIPQGLACLALHLDKLNLTHNKLVQIGPIENYPAGLKWLDLSYNGIKNEVVFECEGPSEQEMYSYGSLSVKTCYNPSIQNKQIRRFVLLA